MIPKTVQELLEHSKTLSRVGALKSSSNYQDLVAITNFLPSDCSVLQRLWHVEQEIWEIPRCKTCNEKPRPWNKMNGGSYRNYCSSKCAHNDPEVTGKTKRTNLERYGVVSSTQRKEVREKIAQTVMEKYGVDNPSKHPDIRAKKSINAIKQKNKNIDKQHEIAEMIERGCTQDQIGKELNISQPRVHHLLSKLSLQTQSNPYSQPEKEILEYIKSLTKSEILTNTKRVIPPYELDIFVPSKSIAVEVNGCYWHSELSGKNRQYHNTKLSLCNDHYIRLYQILDCEWIDKTDIVKSRLESIFNHSIRVYARTLTCRLISCQVADDFINSNHIQGIRSAKYNLGLYDESDRLLSVMSFSKSTSYDFELIRFCNLLGYSVVGGASKLLSHFIRQHSPQTILSYADRRWSDGNLYLQLQFKYNGVTQPNYWYFDRAGNTRKLYSRQKFQKHKLEKQLKNFDPNLTEWENMQNHGYDRIWDCGSSKWVWEA